MMRHRDRAAVLATQATGDAPPQLADLAPLPADAPAPAADPAQSRIGPDDGGGATLTIIGPTSGTMPEQISNAQRSTISFQVMVSDSFYVAPILTVQGSVAAGTIGATNPVEDGSPYVGLSTVTYYPATFETGTIPISLDVSIAGEVISASETFTVTITPVDPPPFFDSSPGSITMNEGDGAKSMSSGYFQAVDLTPSGQSDAGALTYTVSSSDTALIGNNDIVLTPTGSPGIEDFTVYSEAGEYGSDTITLTASDGTLSASALVPVTVQERAIAPTITAPATDSFIESSVSQDVSIPLTVLDPNGAPYVTLTNGTLPSGWSAPTLTQGADGQDTIAFTVAPYSAGSGTLSIQATSSAGTAGALSSNATIVVSGQPQHLDFSVPATQSFSIPENDGGAVIFGFGSIPVTDANGDSFSFKILSGDPPVSATDSTPLYSVSNTGVFYVNGPTPWSPSGGDKHIMNVQVSNGAHTHNDVVTVIVTDNSPPLLALKETPATQPAAGGPVTPGVVTITASDPHDLGLTFAIPSQIDHSGAKPYVIAGVTKSGTTYTAEVFVYPTAPHHGARDTLAISATDTQGLQTEQTVSFFPDIVHTLTAGAAPALSDQDTRSLADPLSWHVQGGDMPGLGHHTM